MPHTMTKAQAFDEAFRPTDENACLDALIRTISRVNLSAGSGMMRVDGVSLMVAPHYCAHCGVDRHCDNGTDGEADCIHKQAMAREVAERIAEREADQADLRATYEYGLELH